MANLDLSKYGIKGDFEIVHNPSYETLFQDEMNPANEGFERAKLTKTGATAVYTGKFTGRSPKDKFFVKDAVTENTFGTVRSIDLAPRRHSIIAKVVLLNNFRRPKTVCSRYILRNK